MPDYPNLPEGQSRAGPPLTDSFALLFFESEPPALDRPARGRKNCFFATEVLHHNIGNSTVFSLTAISLPEL